MKKSLVIISPVGSLSMANTLGAVLGLGENNFTVPLSSDDGETVTHYGLLHQASLLGFRDTLAAARSGNLPPINWSEYGVTEADVQAVIDSLVIDAAETPHHSPTEHFFEVLADQGLVLA